MMKKYMLGISLTILCALMIGAGCGDEDGGKIDNGPLIEFSIKTIDGDTVTPEDFRGKVLMVDYWATWCAACKKEFPEFVKLLDTYGDDFVIIAITVDKDMDTLNAYLDETDWPFIIGLSDESETPSWRTVQVFPTAFIIDREGYLRNKLKGGHPYEDFDEIIKSLIEEKVPASVEPVPVEPVPDAAGEAEKVEMPEETDG